MAESKIISSRVFYAATSHDFGAGRGGELHVFPSRAERAEWCGLKPDTDEFEDGPREAIDAKVARRNTCGENWQYEGIVLHEDVRERGIRRRLGFTVVPQWLQDELNAHYSAMRNTDTGVDFTRTVTYARGAF